MKRWLGGLLGASILLFFSLPVFAQGSGCEAHGFFAYGFDGEAEQLGKDKLKDTYGGGGSFFFELTPYVRLDIGADWLQTEDEDLDNSDITMVPLIASLRVGITLDWLFIYAGGGGGYSVNDLKLKDTAKAALEAQDIYDLELENDAIYFALGGLEVMVAEDLALRIEYRHNWHEPELTYYRDSPGDKQQTDIKLDHSQVRTGLVLYF